MSVLLRYLAAGVLVLTGLPSLVANDGAGGIWNPLAIPNAIRTATNSLINRRGNFPGLEFKPPVKKLADPANLEPDQPPILQAAAKIKQQEDQKRQKIKAIKYVTQNACGCYDKPEKIEDEDGNVVEVSPVTDALRAALQDCTEEVRLAAVRYIGWASQSNTRCECGQCNWCSEEILKELARMAYDIDDTGCFAEPSERVRRAAVETLRICCPNPIPIQVIQEPDPEPEPVPAPPRPDEDPEFVEPVEEYLPTRAMDTQLLPVPRSGVTVTRFLGDIEPGRVKSFQSSPADRWLATDEEISAFPLPVQRVPLPASAR